MLKGYAVLFGRSNEPVRDLIWEFAVKLIIIAVATNYGGWLDAIKYAMEGLHEWASGGVNLYSALDDNWDSTWDLCTIVFDKASWKGLKIDAILGILFIITAFFIAVLPAFFTVVITDFTLQILLMIAPLMIFAKLYDWIKEMFTQWLSLFFTNLLTVLFVGLVLSILQNEITNYISSATAQAELGASPFAIASPFVAVSILFTLLIATVIKISEKIGTVSIESIPSSSTSQGARNAGATGNAISRGASMASGNGGGNVLGGTRAYFNQGKPWRHM